MTSAPAYSCLILGGRGFVGSAIAAEAVRRGYRTQVVDRDNYNAAMGATCDLLINANGNSKKYLASKEPLTEFDKSVRSVMASLKDFRYGRYIQLSSMDVYYPHVSNPADNSEDQAIDLKGQSPYGFHKYLAELLVRHYAGNWLIFRMGGFVGPGLWKNSIFDLLNGHPLRVHPDSSYQYLQTADLARMVLDLAASSLQGEVFNVAGTGVISLRDVAAMIPDCRLDPAWEQQPCERYEMNTAKLSQHATIPNTRESVARFIAGYLEQHRGGKT